MSDEINKAEHYNTSPSGIECIEVVEHMDFCSGNAMKYLWRHNDKENPVKDLRKAIYYIERRISQIEKPEIKLQIIEE